MIKKKKATITGGIAIVLAFVAWKNSAKQRAKFVDWKKQKIENIYFASLDERDIAWG